MRRIPALLLATALLAYPRPAPALLEIPYTLGQICKEATNIAVLRLDSVDKEKRTIVFKPNEDLKGKWGSEQIVHKFGKQYQSFPGEPVPLDEAAVGQLAVICTVDGNGIVLVGRAWYQIHKHDNDWLPGWSGSFFQHAYWGVPKDLVPAVKDILAGKEVIVECMVNRRKDANGRPEVRRLRASLDRLGFDPRRDSVD
jgi:hypothetical protein